MADFSPNRDRTDLPADAERCATICARFHRGIAEDCFARGLTHVGRRHEQIADRLVALRKPTSITILTAPTAETKKRRAA